jgi:hypothetical protein
MRAKRIITIERAMKGPQFGEVELGGGRGGDRLLVDHIASGLFVSAFEDQRCQERRADGVVYLSPVPAVLLVLLPRPFLLRLLLQVVNVREGCTHMVLERRTRRNSAKAYAFGGGLRSGAELPLGLLLEHSQYTTTSGRDTETN